ncbi:MAG: ribonuclease H-like domain-containing protein [Eubacterium sp.]|nr:ribonuclease H-like domain-containing protein [Eubacterium sp.]
MLVFREKVDFKIEYPIETLASKNEVLFFDIETTGFSRDKCFIYLIGCMYYIGDTLMYTQWLAETKNDEANVLMAFHKFMQPFRTIIHFNGNTFDIPFVKARGEKIRLDFDFASMNSLDIYKPVSKLQHLFGLENTRQKSFETLLGINRKDPFTGGELVEVYFEFLRTKDAKLLFPLLLHNKEDVWNMGKLLSLLSLPDLLTGKFQVEDFSLDQLSKDSLEQELRITLRTVSEIPTRISYQLDGVYLIASQHKAQITVQVFTGERKFFFEDYKNYYYLPLEDRAIHKSIASFVDSKYRKQATKATCYEKKNSSFLPVWGDCSLGPVFRDNPSDALGFLEYSLLSEENISDYVQNIFNHLTIKPKK